MCPGDAAERSIDIFEKKYCNRLLQETKLYFYKNYCSALTCLFKLTKTKSTGTSWAFKTGYPEQNVFFSANVEIFYIIKKCLVEKGSHSYELIFS